VVNSSSSTLRALGMMDLQISESIFAPLALAGVVLVWLISGGDAPYVVGFAIALGLPLIGLLIAHRANLARAAIQTSPRDHARIEPGT
jgi:hypothetical protein